MKLKYIVPYCLNSKNIGYDLRYYWIVNGVTYTIDSLETKGSDFTDGLFNYKLHFDSVNYIHLSRYNFCNHDEIQKKYDPDNNYLSLNLDNEITIFDKFVLVHKTTKETTPTENQIFAKNHYCVANGHVFSSDSYSIGLYHADALGGMATDLRTVFKDLIDPPVQSKPAELVGCLDERTIDQELDDIVDKLTQQNRNKAIKKLKRMLNERL